MRISLSTPKAVKYACLKFHYAKAVPAATFAFNVFNGRGEWCGVILYGFGAAPQIASPFDLFQGEVLELLRVALNGKQETTSQAVALTLKELRKIAPQVKIIVSYADIDQEHTGTIYQATNWFYLGKFTEGMKSAVYLRGKKTHNKTVVDKYGTSNIEWLQKHVDKGATAFITKGKHKYIFCLCKKQRKKWKKRSKEYPKRND